MSLYHCAKGFGQNQLLSWILRSKACMHLSVVFFFNLIKRLKGQRHLGPEPSAESRSAAGRPSQAVTAREAAVKLASGPGRSETGEREGATGVVSRRRHRDVTTGGDLLRRARIEHSRAQSEEPNACTRSPRRHKPNRGSAASRNASKRRRRRAVRRRSNTDDERRFQGETEREKGGGGS